MAHLCTGGTSELKSFASKMMVEDLGIEAKDVAAREVSKFLTTFELLPTISSIKADDITRQQANDAQLSTMVAEQDIEGMMSISTEAAEARNSLSDDKEIINTYERLTALDGKRRFALAAATSHKEEVGRLRDYFEDIDWTWEVFEKTLRGLIANYYRLAKDSPQTLVRAVRVVEMQEVIYQQLAEEAAEAEVGDAIAIAANTRRFSK